MFQTTDQTNIPKPQGKLKKMGPVSAEKRRATKHQQSAAATPQFFQFPKGDITWNGSSGCWGPPVLFHDGDSNVVLKNGDDLQGLKALVCCILPKLPAS